MDFLVTQVNTVLKCLINSQRCFLSLINKSPRRASFSDPLVYFLACLSLTTPQAFTWFPRVVTSLLRGSSSKGSSESETGQLPRSASPPGAGLQRGNATLLGATSFPNYVIQALIFLLCCWRHPEQY